MSCFAQHPALVAVCERARGHAGQHGGWIGNVRFVEWTEPANDPKYSFTALEDLLIYLHVLVDQRPDGLWLRGAVTPDQMATLTYFTNDPYPLTTKKL